MENRKNKITSKDLEMDNFSVNLFSSLKEYGYVFPKTDKDVEKFEALYGNTEIETPLVQLPSNKTDLNFPSENFDFKMAAYSPTGKSSFSFPEDVKERKTPNKKKKK